MTSATDELRRLLDERGVENVWKFDGSKMWDSDGKCRGTVYETQWESPDGLRHLTFTEYPNKERTTRLVVAWHPTPAQAVDATLGRGTCHVAAFGFCSECGARMDGIYQHYCPNCGARVVEP